MMNTIDDVSSQIQHPASSELSEAARLASKYLYSSLKPYTLKSPFSELLTDGFDAEQIWQQIDLQSQPLLASIGRQIRQFEKKPEEIGKVFGLGSGTDEKKSNLESEKGESEEFKDVDMDDDDDEEEEEEEEEEDEDELEEYMEDDEAREYGLKKKTKKRRSNKKEDEDEDEEEEGEEGDEDDELGFMGLGDDEDGEGTETARYEDFFGSKKGAGQKKNVKSSDLTYGLETDDDMIDDNDDNQKKRTLSTHEKEVAKLRSTIEDMEKANLEEKAWTMQGEVTAARRPKNSALEVDLDFEQNVRPAPVITEEVTATLEELIQNRIIELVHRNIGTKLVMDVINTRMGEGLGEDICKRTDKDCSGRRENLN
ncbi:hypothetical protein T459_33395 [Capsicum annuum]|uniref:Uncharacterized protein n=1 Tax=Capsicum annuum TaxID=4072 RepID=A0A2G2XZ24_CAPAN|nr:hypothetical protein T459_33395 [Capsicum annuum]